jgi:hypothetical protein
MQQNVRGGNDLSLSTNQTSDTDKDVTAGSIAHVMIPKRCAVVYRRATDEEYLPLCWWYRTNANSA